ncbi:rhodanese-like domain-containing protein [Legionella saoudiensis]|uniref:rhodanese-like domain-containing protein n=1 Tax=Legionella saoudiensis TaxID=1750561 RepID=UPI0007309B93|nr:rhodanese-like domain-containing protein [Legionella saoudiensis]
MTNPKIKTIDVHELKNKMEQNPQLCLIDVREQEEWQSVRIPNAIHIPKDSISSNIEAHMMDKESPIYLHCKGGIRSLYAAQCLIDLGYQEVYSVDGGIMEWAMFGYPIEQ